MLLFCCSIMNVYLVGSLHIVLVNKVGEKGYMSYFAPPPKMCWFIYVWKIEKIWECWHEMYKIIPYVSEFTFHLHTRTTWVWTKAEKRGSYSLTALIIFDPPPTKSRASVTEAFTCLHLIFCCSLSLWLYPYWRCASCLCHSVTHAAIQSFDKHK